MYSHNIYKIALNNLPVLIFSINFVLIINECEWMLNETLLLPYFSAGSFVNTCERLAVSQSTLFRKFYLGNLNLPMWWYVFFN